MIESMPKKMTAAELQNLVNCYIHVEGYTDFRSIYNILKQEYPDTFDHKMAFQVIIETLKQER